MGEFALPTNKPFVTTRRELKNRPLTEEERERREFINNHSFALEVDDKTKTCRIIVLEGEQKND